MKTGRRLYRYRTVQILSLVVFSVMAVILTLLICDRDYSHALIKKYSESRSDIIYQVSEKLSQTYKGAHTLSNSYFYSDYLDTIAEASENYLSENISTFNGNIKMLDMTAMNLMIAYDFDYYVVMEFTNGYHYISRNRYLSTYGYDKWSSEDYSAAWRSNEGNLSLSGPYTDYIGKEKAQILVFGRTFFGSYRAKKGYLLVCIPEKEFSKEYETIAGNSDIYLLDSENKIISSNKKEYLGSDYPELFGEVPAGKTISDNEEYLITSYYDESSGITLIEHYPYKNIVSAAASVHQHVMIAVLLIGGIIIVFAVVYADLMSRRLRKLSEEVGRVDEKHLDITFSNGGWYEINQIACALSEMQGRIRRLITEIREKEKNKREAEIRFLQAQMNPHVIYNTIFCAKCLVDAGESEKASHMLSQFIDYLRWLFNSGGKILTVREMTEHLNQYIDIMKYRYADNFDVIYNIQKETEDAYIINMLLQPIVENAILHGIAPSDKKCRLTIAIERQDERLVICVSNDGMAMTEEESEKYQRQLNDTEQHHGMNNVYNRLQTAYPDNFSLQVVSGEEETQVIIVIPYITEDRLEEIE